MDIKAKIDAIVAQRVESILSEMFGQLAPKTVSGKADDYRLRAADTDKAGRPIDDPNYGTPAKASQNGSESTETASERRRGRRGATRAKVAYKWNWEGRLPEMHETAEITARAIKAAGEPITAFEIEKATGLKQKTVESCVFFLRQIKVVRSVKNPKRKIGE